MVLDLLKQGLKIQGITIDGKKGLVRSLIGLGEIPIQICQYHQIAIVQRYLTRHPKLQASIDLLAICKRLSTTTQSRFTKKLDEWYELHGTLLEERTLHPTTGKSSPTHAKLKSAYRSLRTNLPYLFTYKNYPNNHIPNTTNHLDGGVFSHLKKLVKIHQGLAKKRLLKLIDDHLTKYNKK